MRLNEYTVEPWKDSKIIYIQMSGKSIKKISARNVHQAEIMFRRLNSNQLKPESDGCQYFID